jgi:hypothetical protein
MTWEELEYIAEYTPPIKGIYKEKPCFILEIDKNSVYIAIYGNRIASSISDIENLWLALRNCEKLPIKLHLAMAKLKIGDSVCAVDNPTKEYTLVTVASRWPSVIDENRDYVCEFGNDGAKYNSWADFRPMGCWTPEEILQNQLEK